MVRDIVRFELGQHVRGLAFRVATTVLFAYWFFFTLKLGYDPNFWGLGGEVNHNAPVVFYTMLATQSFVAFVIVPAFMASPLLKDLEHRTGEWLYACPVSARGVFWGRFLAAFAALALVVTVGSLGIVLAPHAAAILGLVKDERVVRLPFDALLSAWCMLLLPTLFVGASSVYSLCAISRRHAAAAAATVVLVLGTSVAHYFGKSVRNDTLLQLLDPTGFHALRELTRHWNVEARNHAPLPLQGTLLLNRCLWSSAAICLLLGAAWRFELGRFLFGSKPRRDRHAAVGQASEDSPRTAVDESVSSHGAGLSRSWIRTVGRNEPMGSRSSQSARFAGVPAARFDRAALVARFWERTRFETGALAREPALLACLALCLVWALVQTFGGISLRSPTSLPTTEAMLESRRGLWMLTFVFVPFAAVTALFRERSAQMDEITGPLPVPDWLVVGSKLLALALLCALVPVIVLLAGLVTQLWHGASTDIGLYAFDLGLVYYPYLLQLLLFAFGLGALLTSRGRALALVMLVLYLTVFAKETGLVEHELLLQLYPLRLDYGSFVDWREHLDKALSYAAYWLALATLVAALGTRFVPRGISADLATRLRLASQRVSKPWLIIVASGGLCAALCATWILHNEVGRNGYASQPQRQRARARYERLYRPVSKRPQPVLQHVEGSVVIEPQARRSKLSAGLSLRNATARQIEQLHVEGAGLQLALGKKELARTLADSDYGRAHYALPAPVPAGGSFGLQLRAGLELGGFSSGRNRQLRVARNGTYLPCSVFYRFGYDRSRELDVPQERTRHGLGPRAPGYARSATPWLNEPSVSLRTWNWRLTTKVGQRAVAPGRLVGESNQGSHVVFEYASEHADRSAFVFLSGEYRVQRTRARAVQVEVWALPQHQARSALIARAAARALDFLASRFGPYPYTELRIVEAPNHAERGVYANLVVLPERDAFTSDQGDAASPHWLDYTLTGQLAAHYFDQVLGPAAAPGRDVLRRGVPEYLAWRHLELRHGRDEVLRSYVPRALERYFWYHGIHATHEVPLSESDGNEFLDITKTALGLRRLAHVLSPDQLESMLSAYLERWRGREQPPFAHIGSLRAQLLESVKPGVQPLIEEVFGQVVHYRNRVLEARILRQERGDYILDLSLEAHRLRATPEGGEDELEWHRPLVVAIEMPPRSSRGASQNFRYVRVLPGKQHLRLRTDARPTGVRLDPELLLLDANPSDNFALAIEEGS